MAGRSRLDTIEVDALFNVLDAKLGGGRPAALPVVQSAASTAAGGASCSGSCCTAGGASCSGSTAVASGAPNTIAPGPAPTPSILDVTITATQPRRDASGSSFDAHTLRTRTAEGPTLWAERRYSDFVCLHEEVFPVLALPEAFPVSTAVLRAPGSRTSQRMAVPASTSSRAAWRCGGRAPAASIRLAAPRPAICWNPLAATLKDARSVARRPTMPDARQATSTGVLLAPLGPPPGPHRRSTTVPFPPPAAPAVSTTPQPSPSSAFKLGLDPWGRLQL